MYVLLDIEWFQLNKDRSYITQAAVQRINEANCVTDDFSCLICPPDPQAQVWTHMAYNGYAAEDFLHGCTEEAFIDRLDSFLCDEDILCVWSKDSRKLLKKTYMLYKNSPLPNPCIFINDMVYSLAKEKRIHVFEMYALADALGMDTPTPKHCSVKDIGVLTELFCTLDPAQIIARHTAITQFDRKELSKQERNAFLLSVVPYNYVFTPNSSVFHKRNCSLMLQANEIIGCTYYERASKKRRPCKRCRPDFGEKVTLPPKEDFVKRPESSVINVKLISGEYIQIKRKKLVGCCHNTIHPGKLTSRLMLQHDCLGKQCRYFEKYEDGGYWVAQKQKQIYKDKRKALLQKQKEQERRLGDELDDIKEEFQSYVDFYNYAMQIVRIQKEDAKCYKVFYVSENRFADGNRFPEFLNIVKHYFPQYRIELRHIRDVDGHFVTIDEYAHRRR